LGFVPGALLFGFGEIYRLKLNQARRSFKKIDRFGIWTLCSGLSNSTERLKTKHKEQSTKIQERFPLSLFPSSMPNSASIPSAQRG
jgi:hypothetical protein